MTQNNIPLKLGCTINSLYLISKNSSITYKNSVYRYELLFSIATSVEASIWKELCLAIAIGITVDE
ncbi:26825_t:CDS:1, partial [Racocetra persica]